MAKKFTIEEFVALQVENKNFANHIDRLEDDLKTANEHCAQLEDKNRGLRKRLAELDGTAPKSMSIDELIGNMSMDRAFGILRSFGGEDTDSLDKTKVAVLINDPSEKKLAAEILCATDTAGSCFIPANPDEQFFLDLEAEFDLLVVTEKCYDRTLIGNETASKIMVSYGDAVEDLKNILQRVG